LTQNSEIKHKTNYFQLSWISLTLILLIWICNFYNLEVNLGIPKLFTIALLGFLFNHFISNKYQFWLLFTLGVAASFVVLNPLNVLILYLVGIILFFLLDPQLAKKIRIIMLIGVVAVLTYIRSQYNFDFVQSRMWVILASIFIFRTIIYFKRTVEIKDDVPIVMRFNYFFLFPNIFVPLFPIVDYKDYITCLSKKEERNIQIDGINLICLGVIQLFIYRILYTYFLPNLGNITNLKTLLIYIGINYLLVFRLMGMLNVSVGILRLFGFNLLEIFNNIFIATSVSDFFRRLNIYWKEFLLNHFYYPLYFRFRKLGMFRALGISAVITFVFNWFFHAYQWFWILGTSPIRWTDTIFWTLFSIVAIVEMLYQAKNPKKSKNEFVQWLLWPIKVMLTFSFIAVIWSLWTSPGLSFWFQTVSNGFLAENQSFAFIFWAILIIYLFALLYKKYINEKFENIFARNKLQYQFFNVVILSVFFLFTFSSFTSLVSSDLSEEILQFAKAEKNTDDISSEAEGYYDGILEFNIGSANWDSALEEDKLERSEYRNLKSIRIELEDLRSYNFKPNSKFIKEDLLFETNAFGLRDREYATKPKGKITRIAFVGGSPEAGLNISNDEILENIVEDSLNLLLSNKEEGFEILNFSHNGYTGAHYKSCLEYDVKNSNSEYVMFVVRTRDFLFNYKKLYKSYITERKILDDPLKNLISESGIEFYAPMDNALQVKYGELIWKWSYEEIKKLCESYKIKPIMLYIPELNQNGNENSNLNQMKEYASGLRVDFIDLSGVYDGEDILSLNKNNRAAANHPNAKGHQVIANKLYDELLLYFKLSR